MKFRMILNNFNHFISYLLNSTIIVFIYFSKFFSHDFDFAMKPSNGVEGFVYNDSSVKAVLSVRLLQVPEFKSNFTRYLEMIMNLNMTQLLQRTDTIESLIFPQLKVKFIEFASLKMC